MFSRMVWKKYKNHNTNNGYDNNGLRREDSCDAVKSSSFMQSAEEVTIYRVSLTYYFVWLFSPRASLPRIETIIFYTKCAVIQFL